MASTDAYAGAGGDEPEPEVPPQIAELAQSTAPSGMRGIRACKRCGILKTLDQFLNEGCENCPFLDMVRNVLVGSMGGDCDLMRVMR
jgi:hypothetical protein